MVVTRSSSSELLIIRKIAFDAAFCSHQAWSVRISSRFPSAILAHLGSVANFSPNISFCFSINFVKFNLQHKNNLDRVQLKLNAKIGYLPDDSKQSTVYWTRLAGTNFFRSRKKNSAIGGIFPQPRR